MIAIIILVNNGRIICWWSCWCLLYSFHFSYTYSKWFVHINKTNILMCKITNLCVLNQTSHSQDRGAGYSLHQLQGDKQAGLTRTGHLLKKSEGKMRRVWQKRRCCVQAEGFLDICHADETKTPTRVNLLTCQIKMVPDDKRCFDLVSCESLILHCMSFCNENFYFTCMCTDKRNFIEITKKKLGYTEYSC